jgi:hypothetical protein
MTTLPENVRRFALVLQKLTGVTGTGVLLCAQARIICDPHGLAADHPAWFPESERHRGTMG